MSSPRPSSDAIPAGSAIHTGAEEHDDGRKPNERKQGRQATRLYFPMSLIRKRPSIPGFPSRIAWLPLPSTLQMLWNVVRLRYQLLWAQARTSSGRRALFIAAYAFGGSLLLLLSFGGSAAAMLSSLLERGEETARWIFTGIWVNGVTTGLLLGRGVPPASLDAALGRYPLTRMGRLCSRHLTGLLDPIWLFLSAITLGLAAGFAVAGPGRTVLSLPAVLLFIAICYLSSLVLTTVAGLLLFCRGGGTIVGAAAFILFSAAGLLTVFLTDPANASWRHGTDLVLRFLPPGAAASLLASAYSQEQLLDLTSLLLWFVFLGAALKTVEGCTTAKGPVASISDSVGVLLKGVESLFGHSIGPLVGKALRYHLRCDRVRFSVAATVPLVLLLPHFMGRGGGPYRVFLETMALMFLAGILATASITLNQFGYDGGGICRYWILPIPAVSSLFAASIASLFLGGGLVLVAIAGLPLLAEFRLDFRAAVMLTSSACSGLLLFNSLGLWTSVLSPRRGSFRGVIGNELSFGATLAIGLGIAFALAVSFAAEKLVPFAELLDQWWTFPLLAVLCAALYVTSYQSISKFFPARRESLIRAVSGSNHL